MAIVLKGMTFKRAFPKCDMCYERQVVYTANVKDDKGDLVTSLKLCAVCQPGVHVYGGFTLEVDQYDDEATSVEPQRR